MIPLARPAVTVTALPHPGGIKLQFTACNRRIKTFTHIIPDRAHINAVREVLDERLTMLKDVVPDLSTELTDFSTVSARLMEMGRYLVYELFGARRDVIEELRTFWRSAIPTWRNPTVTPLIHCHGDEASMLPLEVLPMFRMGDFDVSSRLDFVARCRAFVGFSCIVSRSLLPLQPSAGGLLRRDSDGRAPIRYMHHEGLRGAKTELDWLLSGAASNVTVEGPYPGSGLGEPTVAAQIFDPCLLLGGGRRDLPDQIQHFSCHCYTRMNEPPRKYEIQLRGGGRDVRVTLGEIGIELIRLADDAAEEPELSHRCAELPLVVMNACGTSVLTATCSVSFPALFMKRGNRGFIGTEVAIPDDVAAVFSRSLYEGLFLQAQPVGAAVHQARRHLLERYGNPLGIAYSVYGDSDLMVERHVDTGMRNT